MQILYSVIFQIEFERKKNKRWKLEFKKMKSKEEYFSLSPSMFSSLKQCQPRKPI